MTRKNVYPSSMLTGKQANVLSESRLSNAMYKGVDRSNCRPMCGTTNLLRNTSDLKTPREQVQQRNVLWNIGGHLGTYNNLLFLLL